MAKKKTATKGVVETGEEIRKTNQMFISVRSIGMVDEKGKSIFSIGYGGKITASPDRGLSLIISLTEKISQMVEYSSVAAAQKDLQFLKNYINGIEIAAPKDK